MSRKNVLLCLAWIGSTLVIGFLLWFFTMPYRTRLLIETVNKTLAANGGGRIETQAGVPLSPVSGMGGAWFSAGADSAFVFVMLRNGIAASCVALVDGGGKVKTILPLGDNARQLTDELPLPVYRFYVDRIERDAAGRMLKRGAGR